jgi:protein-S-isoprenylcysteine O-methyltransferase Ste14
MYVFIIIWCFWFISEILLTRVCRSKALASKEFDKRSFHLIWIAAIASIAIGVLIMMFIAAPISRSLTAAYIGLILIILGIIIRVNAITTLGKYFTVNLDVRDDQHLVKKGLYNYIRHPSYAGALLSFLGLGISFNNWISTLAIIIPVFSAIMYRIRIEERLMLEQFGQEYLDYKKCTRRLIPMIY